MITKSVPFTLEITEAPEAPDFFLAIDPTSTSVVGGSTAVFSLSFSAVGGWSSPIQLSVSGLPAGATATFSKNPALVSDTVTVSISTNGVQPGVYQMSVISSVNVNASPMI